MAEEKMNNKQPAAAPTLPVSMEKTKHHHHHHQQQQTCSARLPFLHIHIHLDVKNVNLWTLFNAVVSFAGGVAYNFLMITSPPRQASWQYLLVSALMMTMLWFSTPQAALGALALLLPSNRWRLRRAAAYAALTITAAGHCMFAGAVIVVLVGIDPRDEFFFIMLVGGSAASFLCAVWDLLGFLALLRGAWAQ